MKPAVIFWVSTRTPTGYAWKWRSADGKTSSDREFPYYHDCVADAKANGYPVEAATSQGNTSPGWGSLPGR